MKLYRLVQNVITQMEHPDSFESLYYSMGYTSFEGTIRTGMVNKFPRKIGMEEGKFLYMFPEHAVEYIRSHPLYNDCFKFIEYDIPEEIVYDTIGVGEYGTWDYGARKFDFPKAETYIFKSDFGTVVRSNEVLSREEKLDAYLDEEYKRLKAEQVLCDIEGSKLNVLDYFGCDSVDEIPRDEYTKMLLEEDSVLKWFLKANTEIAKSDFITGRSITLFRSSGMEDERVNEANRRLIEESEFDFDYTCDKFHHHEDARYDYARLIEEGKYDEAREFMKRIDTKEEEGRHVYYLKPATTTVGVRS